ncbi:hypothetical protein EC973_008090 [Apophysomyces ossiformis]|uniref:Uncharacterized protein n=1 Tax=Apophysomyces ossiformis TaxID=679940 RepID=A0A8H7BR18_9FUNG|nr:hypothetical protein EC973_008090 [Apophysomyces ossiformis]
MATEILSERGNFVTVVAEMLVRRDEDGSCEVGSPVEDKEEEEDAVRTKGGGDEVVDLSSDKAEPVEALREAKGMTL